MIDFPRNEGLEFAEWTTSPSTLVQWMQKDLNNTSDRKIKDAKSFQREKAGHLEKIMSPRIPGNPFKCWKNIVFLYRSLYLAKMSIKCGNSIKTFSDLQSTLKHVWIAQNAKVLKFKKYIYFCGLVYSFKEQLSLRIFLMWLLNFQITAHCLVNLFPF